MLGKEKVIEFLFNEDKYRFEKFVLWIWSGLIIAYLGSVFQISLPVIFIPVLTLVLVISVIKIMKYNKARNIKTRAVDWIGIMGYLMVLIVVVFLFYREEKVENAVYNDIEERVGTEDFSIKYIDGMGIRENNIIVSYSTEDDNTKYLGWYYWRNGEVIHDLTREMENEVE